MNSFGSNNYAAKITNLNEKMKDINESQIP